MSKKIPLVPVARVGAVLGVSRPVGEKIAQAGLSGPVHTDGYRDYLLSSRLEELKGQDVTPLDQLPPALIVKVGPAQEVNEDHREYMGWDADADRQQNIDGVRQWWPVANPLDLRAGLLVATIGGFPVEVLRIVGHVAAYGRVAFDVEQPSETDKDAAAWRNARIAPRGGGIVDRHRV